MQIKLNSLLFLDKNKFIVNASTWKGNFITAPKYVFQKLREIFFRYGKKM